MQGFNTVMKRLHEWEEASFDMCVLTLYHLQTLYLNSMNLGRNNRGDYHLLNDEFPQMRMSGKVLIEINYLLLFSEQDIKCFYLYMFDIFIKLIRFICK